MRLGLEIIGRRPERESFGFCLRVRTWGGSGDRKKRKVVRKHENV